MSSTATFHEATTLSQRSRSYGSTSEWKCRRRCQRGCPVESVTVSGAWRQRMFASAEFSNRLQMLPRTDAAADVEIPAPERSRAIMLLACAAFSSAAAFRVCDPQLPQLAEQFATSTGDAALVVTSFALAYGALQLIYGPFGDRYGK